MRNKPKCSQKKNTMETSELFPPEALDCIEEVLEMGAKKYAPHDWERPEAQSIQHPKNCDAIFHHLAREFVFLENKDLIDSLMQAVKEDSKDLAVIASELCVALKLDVESRKRHLQHVATRSIMSYVREARGLDK